MIFKQSGKYPSLTEFIENGGRLEIGYIYELEVSAIMVDEGGMVWEGRKEGYASLEALLDEAEKEIQEWMSSNW